MAFRCQPTRPSWPQHLHEAQGSSIRRREMCDIQHLSVATSAEVDQLRAEMSRQHQNWKKISNWKHTLTFIHFAWFLKLQKWVPLIQEPASVLEGSPLSPWEDAIWAVICSWPWNAYLSPMLLTSCGFKWLEEVKPTPITTNIINVYNCIYTKFKMYIYMCVYDYIYILFIYAASHPDQPAIINPPVDPNLQECTVWDPPGQLEWSLQGQTRLWPWNQVGHGKMMSCTKYPKSPSWINLESRPAKNVKHDKTCAMCKCSIQTSSPFTYHPSCQLGMWKKNCHFWWHKIPRCMLVITSLSAKP